MIICLLLNKKVYLCADFFKRVPDRPGCQVIAIHVDAAGYWSTPYTYDSKPYIRIESTTVAMPRDMFEDRLMRSKVPASHGSLSGYRQE